MAKNVPLRTCLACRCAKPKNELVRIVKYGDEISLDLTGKKNGRGAYVCKDQECFKKLKKGKLLNKAFSCQVSEEIYDLLSKELDGNEQS